MCSSGFSHRLLPPSLLSLLILALPFRSSGFTPSPAPSPAVDIIPVVESLRSHAYFVFAAIVENTPRSKWNFTGTVLAPSDAVFLSIAERFKISPLLLSRPSISFLLYHTLTHPLPWQNLTSLPNGTSMPTLYQDRCLYLRRAVTGEIYVAGKITPSANNIKIVEPDMYLDGNLAVHGTDGILDESQGSACAPQRDVSAKNSLYLEHAVRDLRRRGYSVVALGLRMRRNELSLFPAITVLAPPDDVLLAGADGFIYDVRYHLIPRRLTFQDLQVLPCGTTIDTLLEGRKLVVGRANEAAVVVNGIEIQPEVYRNGWLVLFSIPRPMDIVAGLTDPGCGDQTVDLTAPHQLSDIGKLPDEGALGPVADYFQDLTGDGRGRTSGSPTAPASPGFVSATWRDPGGEAPSPHFSAADSDNRKQRLPDDSCDATVRYFSRMAEAPIPSSAVLGNVEVTTPADPSGIRVGSTDSSSPDSPLEEISSALVSVIDAGDERSQEGKPTTPVHEPSHEL